MATTLMGALNESVSVFLNVKPDKDPTIVTKELYVKDKLNVSTCAEFVDESYIATLYFYDHAGEKNPKNSCGLFILYVNTSVINDLVKVFGFKNATEAGWEMASDAVAELCSNVAGIFKRNLNNLGYPEIESTIPLKFKGICGGLDIPRGHNHYYRLTSYVWGQTIMMDVILAL